MPQRARAIAAFSPAEGSLYELELAEGEVVDLSDQEAPDGWITVKVLQDDGDIMGIVPEACLELISDDEIKADASSSAQEGAELTIDVEDVEDVDEYAFAMEDANKRQALYDFDAEPGSIYELPLVKDEIVELTEEDAPPGWVAARSLTQERSGLVPEEYLGPAPRSRPDAPTQEELELAQLKKQKGELEDKIVKMELEKKQALREKDEQLVEAEDEKEKLEASLVEVEARDALRKKLMEHRKRLFNDEKAQAEVRRRAMDEEEKIWPSKDQYLLTNKLRLAEKSRLEAEHAYQQAEAQKVEAERALKDAEKFEVDAADKLRANEKAREANARALQLLPGLRELLAPTQEELKMCIKTVTDAVMKNAEESAMLLAKLSMTEDPKEALKQAVNTRNEGLQRLGFARSKDSRPGAASLPGSGRRLTERQPPAPDDSNVGTQVRPHPPGDTLKPVGPRGQANIRMSNSRSAPQSIVSNPRSSYPEKLKETVGGSRATRATKSSTSAYHPAATRRPPTRTAFASPRPSTAGKESRGRSIPQAPQDGNVESPSPTPAAAPPFVGAGNVSCQLPPETWDGECAGASATAPAVVAEPPASEQPETEPARQPAWRAIATVAPITKKPARALEAKHKEMRKELRSARKAIVNGGYGRIDVRFPTNEERVQLRTSQATYNYMMRQRKARAVEMSRREMWDANFTRH